MTSSGGSTVNGWAEFVKQCAENCNCNAETNTANQANVLVSKLAQKMDDKGVGQEQQSVLYADFTLDAQNSFNTNVTVAQVRNAMSSAPVIGTLHVAAKNMTYNLGSAMLMTNENGAILIGFGMLAGGKPIVYTNYNLKGWSANLENFKN